MKIKILLSVLLFSFTAFGQNNLCRKNIIIDNQLIEKNEFEKYKKYDFSSIWQQTKNESIYGIIGDEHHRILIKFIFIEKSLDGENEYLVYGKSNVKSNICDFIGKITILKIQEFKNLNFGIDDEYKNLGIKTQGLLTAKYEFFENKEQSHSGKFQGILQSKWYLDRNDNIKYNDIYLNSDSYLNNAFVGTWEMYNSENKKKCNWGDYRVPNSNCDFDIGAGEISISEKYLKNGWGVKPVEYWWK